MVDDHLARAAYSRRRVRRNPDRLAIADDAFERVERQGVAV
jgi:hypothetical protein